MSVAGPRPRTRRPGTGVLPNRRHAPIRIAGQVATALWCLVGAISTIAMLSLSEPRLLATQEDPSARAIGVPDQPGSRLVASILALLEERAPGSAPIWVVQPDAGDSTLWHLVRQQLAHLAYPRRVDVLPDGLPDGLPATGAAAGAARADDSYGYAVALGPGPDGDAWAAVGSRHGLTLYRRRAR